MVLNTTDRSNLYHSQNSLKYPIFSVLIFGVKILLIGLRNALIDSWYIFYLIKNYSFLSNPVIQEMDKAPNILCPRCKEEEGSQSYFIFHCKLSKITPDFICEPINLKYTSNISFKITLKTITIGTSSQFHEFYQHLAQRYCFWVGLKGNLCEGIELPFKQ